jgi:hypothetical protein
LKDLQTIWEDWVGGGEEGREGGEWVRWQWRKESGKLGLNDEHSRHTLGFVL